MLLLSVQNPPTRESDRLDSSDNTATANTTAATTTATAVAGRVCCVCGEEKEEGQLSDLGMEPDKKFFFDLFHSGVFKFLPQKNAFLRYLSSFSYFLFPLFPSV